MLQLEQHRQHARQQPTLVLHEATHSRHLLRRASRLRFKTLLLPIQPCMTKAPPVLSPVDVAGVAVVVVGTTTIIVGVVGLDRGTLLSLPNQASQLSR
ncbi:hypothetical protein Hdeb2414_s0023g00634831 [Helianthus debilis subsp. tardiflorus]